MLRLIITSHAKGRMLQRNITEAEVREALAENPPVESGQGNSRQIQHATSDGRILKVWVVWPPKGKNWYVVKSVAWKGESDNGWTQDRNPESR